MSKIKSVLFVQALATLLLGVYLASLASSGNSQVSPITGQVINGEEVQTPSSPVLTGEVVKEHKGLASIGVWIAIISMLELLLFVGSLFLQQKS